MPKDDFPVLIVTDVGEVTQTTADVLDQETLKLGFDGGLQIFRLNPEIKKFQTAQIDEPESSDDEYTIYNWSDALVEEHETE